MPIHIVDLSFDEFDDYVLQPDNGVVDEGLVANKIIVDKAKVIGVDLKYEENIGLHGSTSGYTRF